MAQAKWEIIWREFDINYISKIGAIKAKVINKSFVRFASINNYYYSYLEIYDKITSK